MGYAYSLCSFNAVGCNHTGNRNAVYHIVAVTEANSISDTIIIIFFTLICIGDIPG